MDTIRIEHNYVWHYHAKKDGVARWYFMGSIYHAEVAALVNAPRGVGG